jgi:hypothetical protein
MLLGADDLFNHSHLSDQEHLPDSSMVTSRQYQYQSPHLQTGGGDSDASTDPTLGTLGLFSLFDHLDQVISPPQSAIQSKQRMQQS